MNSGTVLAAPPWQRAWLDAYPCDTPLSIPYPNAPLSVLLDHAARRFPDMLGSPLKWGVIYGLATYVAMNWVVVPLRFDAPLPPKPISIATQLFAHIVLVGIPFALIAAKTLRAGHLVERATA